MGVNGYEVNGFLQGKFLFVGAQTPITLGLIGFTIEQSQMHYPWKTTRDLLLKQTH